MRHQPRRKLFVAFCAAIALVGSYFVSRLVTVGITASANVAVQPFVLEMDLYNYEWNPVPGTLMGKKLIARRSDGSQAEVSNFGSLSFGQNGRKVRYMDGMTVVYLDSIRIKTTRHEPAEAMAYVKTLLSAPPVNCRSGAKTYGGTDTVLGLSVASLQQNSGRWVTTYLAAPSLGCQVLGYKVEDRQDDGTLKLRAEHRVTSLTFSEPDPALFALGEAYEELRPSEFQHRFATAMGIKENDRMVQEGRRDDANFGRIRP